MRASRSLFGFRRFPPEVEVFAVEDTTVQVVWRSLPPGRHSIDAAGRAVTVDADGGPGAVDLDGLPPGAPVTVLLDGQVVVQRVHTLAPPPGPELFRFATVSDCHIGADRSGHGPGAARRRARQAATGAPPERCLRSALAEATAWGAGLVVAKGDLTDHGTAEEWERVAALLGGAGVPVEAVPGNHDARHGTVSGAETMAAAGVRLTTGGVAARDVPGARLVLVDTTAGARFHAGTVRLRTEAVCDLVAGAGPAVVLLHHHVQPWAFPNHWPPGIPGPEGRTFLDAVARANPTTVVTAGHTHRHRSRRHGPLTVTEVGATLDYPGTWAGYVVHEGGIRQVVRRIAAPSALGWTEANARILGGAWGRWSPGALPERCLTVRWAR